MEKQSIIKRGLSGFQLKYIALALMFLDHILYFFEFTGKVPIWFSMLGRISAPIFLFCVVEGFIHTSNRKKYFKRIYAIAIGMGIIQYSAMVFGLTRGDGFFPQNQIFANFAILIVILQGIEWCKSKKWIKGLVAIIFPLVWPYIAVMVCMSIPGLIGFINILHYTILPVHTWIMDGGTIYILIGILLYCLRNYRKIQAISLFIVIILFYGVGIFFMVPGLTIHQFIFEAYEWMSAFAAIPILLYNGEKGQGSKKFFYWFYPMHVYILFILSCFVFYN